MSLSGPSQPASMAPLPKPSYKRADVPYRRMTSHSAQSSPESTPPTKSSPTFSFNFKFNPLQIMTRTLSNASTADFSDSTTTPSSASSTFSRDGFPMTSVRGPRADDMSSISSVSADSEHSPKIGFTAQPSPQISYVQQPSPMYEPIVTPAPPKAVPNSPELGQEFTAPSTRTTRSKKTRAPKNTDPAASIEVAATDMIDMEMRRTRQVREKELQREKERAASRLEWEDEPTGCFSWFLTLFTHDGESTSSMTESAYHTY